MSSNGTYASEEPYYKNPIYKLWVDTLPKKGSQDAKNHPDLPSKGGITPPNSATLDDKEKKERRRKAFELWTALMTRKTEKNKEEAIKLFDDSLADILAQLRFATQRIDSSKSAIPQRKAEVEKISKSGLTHGLLSGLVGRKSQSHLDAEKALREAERELHIAELDKERYEKAYKNMSAKPIEYRNELTGSTLRISEKHDPLNGLNGSDAALAKAALNSKNIQINANIVSFVEETQNSANTNISKYSTKWRFSVEPPKIKGKVSKSRPIFADYQLAPMAKMGGKCRDMPGIILYHSMGSGKTRTAIGLAATLTNKPNSVTIVVPKGLQAPWKNELKELSIFRQIVKKQGNLYEQQNVSMETVSAMKWDLPEGPLSAEEWGNFFEQKGIPSSSVSPQNKNTSALNFKKQGVYSTATTEVQARDFRSLRDLPIWGRFVKSPELYTEDEKKLNSNGRPVGEEPNGPFVPFAKKPIKYEFRFNVIEYEKLLEPGYLSLIKNHVVIFDEAHNLLPLYKSSSCDPAQQYRLRVVLESALRRIFLTGTPIQTEITDLSILINLSQNASAMPIIAESPKIFKNMYYPIGAGEKIQWWIKQTVSPWYGKLATLGAGALAITTGGLIPMAATAVLAGAHLLGAGISASSADKRNLDASLLAKHCAPYVSYFDVEYDSPENKTMFPYKSKRLAAGSRAEISYQNAVDRAWKIAYWSFPTNSETSEAVYNKYMLAVNAVILARKASTLVAPTTSVVTSVAKTKLAETLEDQVKDLVVKIYYNTFMHQNQALSDIIAEGNYTLNEPSGIKRTSEAKRSIPVENDDDEGEIEHAVPFDNWQVTMYVSQFMNLEEPDIDVEIMLDNYDKNLADTFGPVKRSDGSLITDKYKMISERIIDKPSNTLEFMSRMRVICNLSKYCFYYEPLINSDKTDPRTSERGSEFNGYTLDHIQKADMDVYNFVNDVISAQNRAAARSAAIGLQRQRSQGSSSPRAGITNVADVPPVPTSNFNAGVLPTAGRQPRNFNASVLPTAGRQPSNFNASVLPTEVSLPNSVPPTAGKQGGAAPAAINAKREETKIPLGNNTYVTVRKKEFHGDEAWRPPVDDNDIKNLPINYSPADIFQVGKFDKALDLIIDCRQRNHFLPLVYSNFDKYGFQLFSAFLNNRGMRHLIIHSAYEYKEWNEQMLIKGTGLTQLPFPRCKCSKPEDTIDADKWRIENKTEFDHYKLYLDNYPFLIKPENAHIKKALLELVITKEYVPMCILLHPDIKEGLSFTMQPEMICLETPLGIGNRDQIYARIIRNVGLTPQGTLTDAEYYEILPVYEGEKIKYPGVVRPQYIFNGIFLQENMIAYKSEHTPAFAASLNGKEITATTGYLIKQLAIEESQKYDNESVKTLIGSAKRGASSFLLEKMTGSSIEDFEPKVESHYQTVPRVKKVIHQIVGADNIKKVKVSPLIRKVFPSFPTTVRWNWAGLRLEKDGCGPNEPGEKVFGLGRIKWKIDLMFLKMNYKAYWKEYLKGTKEVWKQVGTRTFDEVCAALPVPWLTTTPDDFIDDKNIEQKDTVEKIRKDFFRAEAKGLCARIDATGNNKIVATVNEPLKENCLWQSPQSPGVCRLEDLNFVKGGTPHEGIKLLKAKKSSNSTQRAKPLFDIKKMDAVLNSEYGDAAVGLASRVATRKLTADTLLEPLSKQLEAALKAYLPTLIREGSRQLGTIDIDQYRNVATTYYQNAKATLEAKVETAKQKYEELKATATRAGTDIPSELRTTLEEAQRNYQAVSTSSVAKLKELKESIMKTIEQTKTIAGIRNNINDPTRFSQAYNAVNNATRRSNPTNNALRRLNEPAPNVAIGGRKTRKHKKNKTLRKLRSSRRNK